MSGYVPGYLVPYNLDTSYWPNQSSTIAEITVSSVPSVNEVSVPVLIPNGVIETKLPAPSPFYGSAGLDGGLYPRSWWVKGDVSNIGGKNYTVDDVNNNLRDSITDAYIKYFNRFAGPVAMENWCWTWLYGGGQNKYKTVDEMIRQGGELSGEINLVKSTPYWIPYTYYAPQLGCTDSTASNYKGPAVLLYQRLFTSPVIISKPSSCSYPPPPPPSIPGCTDPNALNYNSNATVDNGSCVYPSRPYVFYNEIWVKSKNVYIRDGESWKLCRDVYIRDGGSWKRSIN